MGVNFCKSKMETNESSECSYDVLLLCYNKLIEVNCETVEKVAVNYVLSVE